MLPNFQLSQAPILANELLQDTKRFQQIWDFSNIFTTEQKLATVFQVSENVHKFNVPYFGLFLVWTCQIELTWTILMVIAT